MLVLGELGVELAPLIASAGIAGMALGFGAQNLVKDFIAGLFMLLEDQYGVGDIVDVGEASGTVEAVGLRITTIRDARGVLWYIRNGEIVRVGNKSQGWALVVVDVPVGFAGLDEATGGAAPRPPPAWPTTRSSPPTCSSRRRCSASSRSRWTARSSGPPRRRRRRRSGGSAASLRRRLTEALENAGITAQITRQPGLRPLTPPAERPGTGPGADPDPDPTSGRARQPEGPGPAGGA